MYKVNWYKKAQLNDSYKGEHESPDKDSGAPLHDVTLNGIYPQDFYSSVGLRYYGSESPTSYYIVIDARNHPNKQIKVYRAIPDFNADINKQILDLWAVVYYKNKYGFLPMNNPIVDNLYKKYPIEQYEWQKRIDLIVNDINAQIKELEQRRVKLPKINPGDWVAIDREYAKSHGEDNLLGKYAIISKTVSAKDIYTDGNITEWGYYP